MYKLNILFAFLAMLVVLATGLGCRNCPSVEIIVARASNEPAGTGIIGEIAFNVQNRTAHTYTRALEYPAWFDPYLPSQTQGVSALTAMLNAYANKCPKTRLVLMGYSQGAHVVSDVLCGGSEVGFPTSAPLVVAVVLMGDPSHVANASYNAGTSVHDGIFPRQNPDGCAAVRDRMIAFCDDKDIFCDSGDNLAVHMAYVIKYGVAAADFVTSLIQGS